MLSPRQLGWRRPSRPDAVGATCASRPAPPKATSRLGSSSRTQDSTKDLAAQLLEQVACLALRARLREAGHVGFDIRCSTQSLFSGTVNAVDMLGLHWESPAGLKARMLCASVGRVTIDTGALFMRRTIVLASPPVGTFRVLFTPSDFGAFLVHPLMAQAASRAVQGSPFVFEPHAITFQPASASSSSSSAAAAGVTATAGQTSPALSLGTVSFFGSCRGRRFQVTLHEAAAPPPAAGAGLGSPTSTASTAPTAGRSARSRSVSPGPPASAGAGGGVGVNSSAAELRVEVREAPPLATAPPSAPSSSALSSSSALLSSASVGSWDAEAAALDTEVVERDLQRFFLSLLIDLQGAELRYSTLRVLPPGALPHVVRSLGNSSAARGAAPLASSSAGGVQPGHEREPVVDLGLSLRVRQFPPLDVQF